MDEQDAPPEEGELKTRPPTWDDVLVICQRLNDLGARYAVVGGFAIIKAGYARSTADIDLLIAGDLENDARVRSALEVLPDKAVLELKPGEVSDYTVVRINDDITVDLMVSTSGITLDDAASDLIFHEIDGVRIPFASPRLLWRMKKSTGRDKDKADLQFLRSQFSEEIFGKDNA